MRHGAETPRWIQTESIKEQHRWTYVIVPVVLFKYNDFIHALVMTSAKKP